MLTKGKGQMNQNENQNGNKLSVQRDVELFLVVLLLTAAFVALFDIIPYKFSTELTVICECLIFILVALPSTVAYTLQGNDIKKLFVWKKGQGKIIFILLIIRLALLFLLHVTKLSEIGVGFITRPIVPLLYLLEQVLFVGVCEEFIFRIYIQETFAGWLGKYKACAPALSALVFGAYHLINAGMFAAVISFFMGLLWGYTRYFNKKCTFTAIAITHGLSNYMGDILAIIYGLILYGGNPMNIIP